MSETTSITILLLCARALPSAAAPAGKDVCAKRARTAHALPNLPNAYHSGRGRRSASCTRRSTSTPPPSVQTGGAGGSFAHMRACIARIARAGGATRDCLTQSSDAVLVFAPAGGPPPRNRDRVAGTQQAGSLRRGRRGSQRRRERREHAPHRRVPAWHPSPPPAHQWAVGNKLGNFRVHLPRRLTNTSGF